MKKLTEYFADWAAQHATKQFFDMRALKVKIDSLLDQEKTAKSSSLEITTEGLLPMTTADTTEDIKKYLTPYSEYKYQLSVSIPALTGVFGCCGAVQYVGCGVNNLTTPLMREEAALKLMSANTIIYFLPTTTQIKLFAQAPHSVLNLLFELGAKEVHVGPNRTHGPNNLHLCVLDRGHPDVIKKVYEKYLFKMTSKDEYGYIRNVRIPRTIAIRCGLLEGEVQNPPSKPPVAKGPARDAYGRFIKVVK